MITVSSKEPSIKYTTVLPKGCIDDLKILADKKIVPSVSQGIRLAIENFVAHQKQQEYANGIREAMGDNAFITRTMDTHNDFSSVDVVSNNAVNHYLPVSTVLPLSAVKPTDKTYPTEVMLETGVTGLPKNSVAMVQQVRTVAHSRLEPPIGSLKDASTQEKILEAIRMYFEV